MAEQKQQSTPKVKTIDELKTDLTNLTNQLKQIEQQHTLISGAKMYLEQTIAKLEKPEVKPEEKKDVRT